MLKQKILIATTNAGKFSEIISHFNDLNFDFVSLTDLSLHTIDLEEPFFTTEENALHKAKFFAQKSGLMTLAEDTSFCVDYLGGEPGIKAKRYASTAEARNQKILQELSGVPQEKRGCFFQTSACLFNPIDQSIHIFTQKVKGEVVNSKFENLTSREGMGYDSIFYYPPFQKTFAELSVAEKNSVSHRGKAMLQVKLFLIHSFAFKQIVVPVALIVKERKMFLSQRRDTRPELHGKWEFPGGGIDPGEEIIDCLQREVKEETGFNIKVIEKIPKIYTKVILSQQSDQIFVIIHICSIESGTLQLAEEESIQSGWFTYQEALEKDMLDMDKKCLEENKDLLLKYIN